MRNDILILLHGLEAFCHKQKNANVNQYRMSSRNNALPGILSPAADRLRPSMIRENSSTVIRPRPTSISVPTTARTILRRKRSAVMRKYHVLGEVCIQQASVTSHSVVFTSVWLLQKAPKSFARIRCRAASFIFSKSKFQCNSQE